MSKLLSHRGALCNVARRIALDAGELIMEYFEGMHDMGIVEKGDGSPVTVADQVAERLIEERLLDILPDIPVVGEESYAQGRRLDFSKHEYFWLIDPLDGTRAFIRGDGDFTVNIGLVHKKEPVLGVVYAPERGEMYAGFLDDNGAKAFRHFEDSDTEKDLRTRSMPRDGLTVMSGTHTVGGHGHDHLMDQLKVKKIVRQSSSLKICAVASGRADVYPRFGPTCEWDTAAGHAILRAAGGDITTTKGESLVYGGDDPLLLNPEFIAASGDFFDFVELS